MASRIGIDVGSGTIKAVVLDGESQVRELPIQEIHGQPLQSVRRALAHIIGAGVTRTPVGVTGVGAPILCEILGLSAADEYTALAAATDLLYPDVRTLLEMGQESQKLISLERDEASGRLLVTDIQLGNKCAAGSGSFLAHMHKRLNYPSLEAFARTACEVESPASLSGRCAVFTESDIVHLYQKGTAKERIAAGVHQAMCRNYKSALVKGSTLRPRVAFLGGVAQNPAMVKYLSQELGVPQGEMLIPEHFRTLGAIGAALHAETEVDLNEALARIEQRLAVPFRYDGTEPLALDVSKVLSSSQDGDTPPVIECAALGVDIGSVSTKAALVTKIDDEWRILAKFYRRTDGDPLAAVRDTLSRIHDQVKDRGYEIEKIVAATTGSGRYLTGDYIGADLVKNEITSQAAGATTFVEGVDSIFEIGGQDSKFVRLNGDTIVDFEMNKACAAGTGAFLEKIAAHLGVEIEDFGEVALQAQRPPDLDWQCTVFSESAILYYQQNNVPREELAAGTCLASVKNYLNKNVGNRDIGERIVFQGAVAFNKGMVAAMETVLGREIIVPPDPHLTGAVGAARLAYEAQPETARFRGFEEVAQSKYTVSSFECKKCPNRCDVNTFQIEGGPKYFYNDRCERYSGVHGKKMGEALPDLFAEREEMLLSAYTASPPAGAQRVGIPRGLLFNDYFPLFNAFFSQLGYEVVISEASNTRIVQSGINASVGEPCFPIKVAHGHVAAVLEEGVDYLFLPGIISTEQPNEKYRNSQTCPYIQSAPEVMAAAFDVENRGVRILTPRLFFNRGEAHVRRVFRELAADLGHKAGEADRALAVALEAHRAFRERVERRAREVYESLGEDDMAFVVIGRPYTLYDRAVNMDIGKKIQDLGIRAIPMDFIPLEHEDISDTWPHLFSRQIQKRLAAGRLIRRDPRLRAVVITYFGCGPDTFGNPFLRDELGEPCYVMQIDEHTADAGVITRIEAFADTVSSAQSDAGREGFVVRDVALGRVRGKRVWIPYASEAGRVLAAAVSAYGVDADVLPRSEDPGLNLARGVITEDVCIPALFTTQDILARVQQPDFDPEKECFFQGNSQGPCRFGMYFMLQRRILDEAGYPHVEMVTLGNREEEGSLGTCFQMVAWDGLVAHDILEKMLHRTRPYEANKGESDAIFEKHLRRVCDYMKPHRDLLESVKGKAIAVLGKHVEPLKQILRDAQAEFEAVEKTGEERPLVGLVGEFYVRLHTPSNQNIVRKLEDAGAEVWLAPLTEFFGYSNLLSKMMAEDAYRDTRDRKDRREAVAKKWLGRLATRDEHILFDAALPYLEDYDEMTPREMIEKGLGYIHWSFGGEAICSMGKSEDFAERGLAGIVSVVPFNCMPGMAVRALSEVLRRKHDNLPFLNLDYDGFVDTSRDAKVAAFMAQVRERWQSRRLADSVSAGH